MIERTHVGEIHRIADGHVSYFVDVQRLPVWLVVLEQVDSVIHKIPQHERWWCNWPSRVRDDGFDLPLCARLDFLAYDRTESFHIPVSDEVAESFRAWRKKTKRASLRDRVLGFAAKTVALSWDPVGGE